jgi:hypothetical protein
LFAAKGSLNRIKEAGICDARSSIYLSVSLDYQGLPTHIRHSERIDYLTSRHISLMPLFGVCQIE